MTRLLLLAVILGLVGCGPKPVPADVVDGPKAQRLEPGGNLYCLADNGATGWPARADGKCYNVDKPIPIDIPESQKTYLKDWLKAMPASEPTPQQRERVGK